MTPPADPEACLREIERELRLDHAEQPEKMLKNSTVNRRFAGAASLPGRTASATDACGGNASRRPGPDHMLTC